MKKKVKVETPKKNKCLEMAKAVFGIALIVYGLASSITLLGGVLEGGKANDYNGCYKSRSRLGSLFPTYTLGCYLGAPTGQEYYNKETYDKFSEMERVENARDEYARDLVRCEKSRDSYQEAYYTFKTKYNDLVDKVHGRK